MQIKLNGDLRQCPGGSTLASLLAELKLTPDKVAIELNRRLVRAVNYNTPLKEADEVEVVTFVGGGS